MPPGGGTQRPPSRGARPPLRQRARRAEAKRRYVPALPCDRFFDAEWRLGKGSLRDTAYLYAKTPAMDKIVIPGGQPGYGETPPRSAPAAAAPRAAAPGADEQSASFCVPVGGRILGGRAVGSSVVGCIFVICTRNDMIQSQRAESPRILRSGEEVGGAG